MKNKILSILIIFMLTSFIFISSSYAIVIDTTYDYLYDYNVIQDNTINSLVNAVCNDDRVISGDYYYFCYYSTGDYEYASVLIPKELITCSFVEFRSFYQEAEDCQTFGLYISQSDISSSIIKISKGHYTTTDSGFCLKISGFYDAENKCFNFPFATNYDGNITYTCSNGEIKTFFQGAPTVPEIPAGKIPETMAEIMKTAGEQATAEMTQIILIVIMTTAGLTVLLIGLKKGLTVLMNGFRH